MADEIKTLPFRSMKGRVYPFLSQPTKNSAQAFSLPRYLFSLIPVLILGVVVYLPMFAWLRERFDEVNSYYSHGYMMPFVAAYLLWQRRATLHSRVIDSEPRGFILIVLGLVIHACGQLFSIGFVSGVSFIVVLFGLSLYLFGRDVTRVAALPLLFLACMIPLPQVLLITLSFKMKIFAAYAASSLVAAAGLPLACKGSSIVLPNGILSVGDQCSGLNSLISLVTLCVAFACASGRKAFGRAALVAGSLPVAISANILRISFLIIVSILYGPAVVTEGPMHFGAGIVLWLSALAMVAAIGRVLP